MTHGARTLLHSRREEEHFFDDKPGGVDSLNLADRLSCKEKLAFGMECEFDTSACADHGPGDDGCSDDDAARRAGHTCDEWPYYGGGYPLITRDAHASSCLQFPWCLDGSLPWDKEEEKYECAQSSADEIQNRDAATGPNSTFAGEFCSHWLMTGKSSCPKQPMHEEPAHAFGC